MRFILLTQKVTSMKLLYFLQLKCKDCVNNKVDDENVTKRVIVHCLPPLEAMIRTAAFPTTLLMAIWF